MDLSGAESADRTASRETRFELSPPDLIDDQHQRRYRIVQNDDFALVATAPVSQIEKGQADIGMRQELFRLRRVSHVTELLRTSYCSMDGQSGKVPFGPISRPSTRCGSRSSRGLTSPSCGSTASRGKR